jgi:hypothetical protein
MRVWKQSKYFYTGSRVSSGSMVSDYGLDDRAIGVRSPTGSKDFSSILCVQTGSGAHPASCTMGTGGPFPWRKSAAGAWRWPLTLIYFRGREWVGAIPPIPPSASMACSGTSLPSPYTVTTFGLCESVQCHAENCSFMQKFERVVSVAGTSCLNSIFWWNAF